MPIPNSDEEEIHDVIASGSSKVDDVLKILILEDDIHDAELIRMYLKKSKLNVESVLVSTKDDYLDQLLTQDFDVILSDHNLPGFSSLEALRLRNEIKFHIPFILVSGAVPE